jgi:cyanophycin synthetase
MGVPQVDVGAVLNVQSDHLGLKGIDTLEQLAEIKRIVVEVASECAVLNADDPNVLKMSGYTDAKVICYVTMNPSHPLVREHIRAGGRACALEAGINGHMITLYDKGSHIPLMWTHLIPATLEGRACTTCRTRWSRRRWRSRSGSSSIRSARACARSTPRSSRCPGG